MPCHRSCDFSLLQVSHKDLRFTHICISPEKEEGEHKAHQGDPQPVQKERERWLVNLISFLIRAQSICKLSG